MEVCSRHSRGGILPSKGSVLSVLVSALIAFLAFPSAQAQTYTVLYSFRGAPDGNGPSTLTKGANGYFYGITSSGGDATCNFPYGCGTIFRIKGTPESVVSRFPAYFEADIRSLMFHTGALYGTTDGGGDLNCNPPYGCGTVFKADLSGNLTVLYTFTDAALGASPQGPLVADAAGNLYGTTDSGGNLNCDSYGTGCGIVFKLDPTGALATLHAFAGGTGGAVPSTSFISLAGNFYGTVSQGGDVNCLSASGGGCGLVYKLNQKGKFTVLHTFTGGSDGAENEHTGPLGF